MGQVPGTGAPRPTLPKDRVVSLWSVECRKASDKGAYRMAEWMRVEMGGEPEVKSDPDYPSVVIVSIPLKPSPNADWTAIFNSGPPPGVTFYVGREFPKASSGAVHFRCTPDEVAMYRDQAERWVDGTNAYYESYVIPEIERQQAAQKAEAEERNRAVEQARRNLEG
jgi:hypothetical protein